MVSSNSESERKKFTKGEKLSVKREEKDKSTKKSPEKSKSSSQPFPFRTSSSHRSEKKKDSHKSGRRQRSKSPSPGPSSASDWSSTYVQSCGLDRQKKAARAGFANELNSSDVQEPAAGTSSKKKPWICCFCRRGTHFASLGDLFGPYVISRKHRSRSGHPDLVIFLAFLRKEKNLP